MTSNIALARARMLTLPSRQAMLQRENALNFGKKTVKHLKSMDTTGT